MRLAFHDDSTNRVGAEPQDGVRQKQLPRAKFTALTQRWDLLKHDRKCLRLEANTFDEKNKEDKSGDGTLLGTLN